MGQHQSNPFREGSELMNDFQIQQKVPQLFLTFLKKKSNNKEYLLRQFTFNDLREFSNQLEILQRRKLITHQHLTNLQIVEDRAEDQMCSSFYKIYTLWEYPKKSLIDEIALRTLQNKPYSAQEIWNLLQSTISPLALLQERGIGHECLTSKIILFQQNGNIKVADPMSFGLTSNIEYVLSNRYSKCIYLSPEQCQSIANHRPIINKNPYKNDVFTLALIILEAALLEKQDKCFLEDCSVINQSLLTKNVGRFGDRYGPELKNIIEMMVDRSIESRPDCISLLAAFTILKNNKHSTFGTTIKHQNDRMQTNNNFNASFVTRQQPPTIAMTPEPDFKRLFQGIPQLSPIPSVSNEGSSSTRQQRSMLPSNQPQLYSNISSIPPYSYVSPIVASNNTSNLNHYEQLQKSLKLKSTIQPSNPTPSLISHSNFHATLSNPPSSSPVHTSPLNVRFVSQTPQNVQYSQNDMSVTFGGRAQQGPVHTTGERVIRQISPNKPPLAEYSQLPRPTLAQSTPQSYQFSSYAGKNMQNQQNSQNIPKQNELIEVQQKFSKGSCYKGYKLNGARHGKGTFYYQDGGRYEGEWKYNKMDGFGRLFYQSDKVAYEGQWVNDQFHGRGILYNQNPVRMTTGFDYRNFDEIDDFWEYYEGYFKCDLKSGSGKLKFSNGQVFEGTFADDMVQGQGLFVCRDGQRIHGIWMENQLVQVLD